MAEAVIALFEGRGVPVKKPRPLKRYRVDIWTGYQWISSISGDDGHFRTRYFAERTARQFSRSTGNTYRVVDTRPPAELEDA